MEIPGNLLYTKQHEWAELANGTAKVGVTDHAQQEMGDIVYLSLPAAGEAFRAGDVLAEIESVKAVSYVYSPVSGRVCAINESLSGAPEKINADPYGAWIAELCDVQATDGLLDAAQYRALLEEGGA